MVGTFASSFLKWLNGLRRRKNLRKFIDRIDPEHSNLDRIVLENEIMHLYTKGKISEQRYKLLTEKLSDNKNNEQSNNNQLEPSSRSMLTSTNPHGSPIKSK
jgi:hypothetical protein